jgi:hypothetical protein
MSSGWSDLPTVTINGSSNFKYELGGNATTGVSKVKLLFSEFAFKMGVDTLPTPGSVRGNKDTIISEEFSTSTSSSTTDPAPFFTLSQDILNVSEGGFILFTIYTYSNCRL